MRIIPPEEAKIIYEILLTHEVRTLSPGCDDPDNLNVVLDHLRGMLMDIADGELRPVKVLSKPLGSLYMIRIKKWNP